MWTTKVGPPVGTTERGVTRERRKWSAAFLAANRSRGKAGRPIMRSALDAQQLPMPSIEEVGRALLVPFVPCTLRSGFPSRLTLTDGEQLGGCARTRGSLLVPQ
ncbi:Hypothetical predicted protein [Cloeon dipterum]|uniref:Uncharacterized protein n=1 Tax=Cloeon dipterum TaxID=197152 RepID=A0A8S1BVY3_9INSE|nr:Hypothetical predicted protein [Cloeon dipterum]